MHITARLQNSVGKHEISLHTNNQSHTISIAPKSTGPGSSANGGELLFLALATCYCNDIYREAAKRAIRVQQVEVTVSGEFGGEGEPARHITYDAQVSAEAPESDILELMRHTDTVAEIQNTLRLAMPVMLERMVAVSIPAIR